MQELREQINEIDEQLLQLLIKRFGVTAKVGLYKKEHGLPIFDEKREQDIFDTLKLKLAKETDAEYILSLWESLLDISKRQQQILVNGEKENV